MWTYSSVRGNPVYDSYENSVSNNWILSQVSFNFPYQASPTSKLKSDWLNFKKDW